jgi:hypothetical protein
LGRGRPSLVGQGEGEAAGGGVDSFSHRRVQGGQCVCKYVQGRGRLIFWHKLTVLDGGVAGSVDKPFSKGAWIGMCGRL